MPSRACAPWMGDSINRSTDGIGTQSFDDGALVSLRSPHIAPDSSRSPSLGAIALAPHLISPTSDGNAYQATPSFNHCNGVTGFSAWELTPPSQSFVIQMSNGNARNDTPPPLQFYGRTSMEPLDRSMPPNSPGNSQRYSHNPYSLETSQHVGSQSLRGDSMPTAPLDSVMSIPGIVCFDENATGPLTVHSQLHSSPAAVTEAAAVHSATCMVEAAAFATGGIGVAAMPTVADSAAPETGAGTQRESRRNEMRNRRKNRQGEIARNAKVLPDLPPPRSMQYLPPPPPRLESVQHDFVSQESFERAVQRWYDRVLAMEGSYSTRSATSLWFPNSNADPSAVFLSTPAPCPRREYCVQPFLNWHREVEQWWESVIRPMTGAPMPPPPPYTTPLP